MRFTSFAIRNSLNRNLRELCPADCEREYAYYPDIKTPKGYEDIADLYREFGYDITEGFGEYVTFHTYWDKDLTIASFFGDTVGKVREKYDYLYLDASEPIIAVSDYNKLMRLYNREEVSLENDEYVLVCDYSLWTDLRDEALADGADITVFGRTLHSKYRECKKGFIDLSAQHLNTGLFIVPDIIPNM